MPIKRIVVITLLALFSASGAFSQQTPNTTRADKTGTGRKPRVALVLSGGAALGIAHVGVLKVLEEIGIPIDCVVGTSMGALVGGLYAIGYSSSDIADFTSRADWASIFSDSPPRGAYTYRKKDIEARYPFTLGIKKDQPLMGGGLLNGRNITTLLSQLTFFSSDIVDFDRFPKQYRAVACDLVTGEEVVFSNGSIVDAMRASMNIPGLFEPYEVNGRYLIDGGVLDNLPVDKAEELGPDIIIAVDVAEPIANDPSAVNNPIAALARSTDIVLAQKARMNARDADIVIRPDLAGLTRLDFSKAGEFIGRGEKAARAQMPELQAIAAKIRATRPLEPKAPGRGLYFSPRDPVLIQGVEPAGMDTPATRDAMTAFTPFIGKAVYPDDLKVVIDDLYGSGKYETVRFELAEGNEGMVLLIRADASPTGVATIGFGLDYNAELGRTASSRLSTLTRFSLDDLTGPRSYWAVEAGLFDGFSISSDYFQPFATYLFLDPSASFKTEYTTSYASSLVSTDYRLTDARTAFTVGASLSKFGEISAAYQYRHASSPAIADLGESPINMTTGSLVAHAEYDTVDVRLAPRRGGLASATFEVAAPWLVGSSDFRLLRTEAENYFRLGKDLTLGLRFVAGSEISPLVKLSGNLPWFDRFSLSDIAYFPGFRELETLSDGIAGTRLSLDYRFPSVSSLLDSDVGIAAAVEAGTLWDSAMLRSLVDTGSGSEKPAFHWAFTLGPVVRIGETYLRVEGGVSDLNPRRFGFAIRFGTVR
jgi:NTE family protein